MNICKVLGNVVSTIKHKTYDGTKLMVVQPVEPHSLKNSGDSYLAVDRVMAGKGDIVLVMSEGNGVRQILKGDNIPIRSLIVGIVDDININN